MFLRTEKGGFPQLPAMNTQKLRSPTKSRKPRPLLSVEACLFVVYLTLAVVWIVFSDNLTDWLSNSREHETQLQTVKGLGFATATAFLIYCLMRSVIRKRDMAIAAANDAGERFEMVARASNDAIWDWNLTNNQIWWSEGFENLFGYSVEELEPTIESWTNRLHPEDRKRAEKSIYAVINGGKIHWQDDYRFRRKDGTYAEVCDRGFVIRDVEGKPIRMVGGMTDVSERRIAERNLELSRRQMRALSARLENLREEERTRIAREIHDELGQMLTGLKMDLRWVEKQLTGLDGKMPQVNSILDKTVEASELTDQTIVAVQNIATELRPGVLDSLGLASAIKAEAARFQERTGIKCHSHISESLPRIRSEVSTPMFRIFQETLTNAARHAKATRIDISLEHAEEQLLLEIKDDGKGISDQDLVNPRSLGLVGMRERASQLGGDITFERASAGGTIVRLSVHESANDTKFWQLV